VEFGDQVLRAGSPECLFSEESCGEDGKFSDEEDFIQVRGDLRFWVIQDLNLFVSFRKADSL